jgi:hypothetical protein
MKKTLLLLLSTSVILASALRAEDEDFTKREVTDPKLVITTQSTLLPEKDDKWMDAVRDENHVPPVYKRLWSATDVIMIEPLSKDKPAKIDFSAITSNNKGVLRLKVRNDPRGDFKLEILKGGQTFKKETIGSGKWERFQIPFDHESVVVLDHANNWSFEFGFFDYSFAKQP